ncbi:hypothetical protein M6B38_337375 [Iris pallida]|uniref:Uncharacterized protein n=1 Tax=Iris pallida TaxID=29817 RepID=A0AAX6GZM2_IRIPA|nr:hypothetical protein M6B38_337375 [Iris pallida]
MDLFVLFVSDTSRTGSNMIFHYFHQLDVDLLPSMCQLSSMCSCLVCVVGE